MKNKKTISFTVFLLLLFFQASAYAILNLELTKGVDAAIPIAIVPFDSEGDKKPSTDVSDVIADDLQNSGQFKELDMKNANQFPHNTKDVDFNYWRGMDINNLVVGNVQAQGNDSYQVTFALIDIYKDANHNRIPQTSNTIGEMINAGINPILEQKTFVAKDKDLRHLAHKISDIIYQKLTGIQGIFSTKIAYILVKRQQDEPTKYSLMIADADGNNPRALLVSDEPIMSPAWSADGKQIAYVSFERRRVSLYISDVATGGRRLVSQFPGINGAPDWSPDGKKMAIVLSQGDNTKIFLYNLLTGKMQPLTDGSAIDTEPDFAPDGKSIIFTSDRSGAPQIYSLDLGSGKIDRITYSGNYNAKASFTPDGQSIVMLHRDQDDFNIAIQDLKTGDITVLTNAVNDQSPSVAPNGKMIIYSTYDGGRGMLALISTDGKVKLTLPESDGEVRLPVWGPN